LAIPPPEVAVLPDIVLLVIVNGYTVVNSLSESSAVLPDIVLLVVVNV
jgi:hypothetical protein